MNTIKVGDKVATIPSAFTRVTGKVVALHPATIYTLACASVYCGRYESVKVPLADLRKLPGV